MLLESEADVEIVGEAGTARDALDSLSRLQPDVVLMDIGLPDMSGIDAARRGGAVLPLQRHRGPDAGVGRPGP